MEEVKENDLIIKQGTKEYGRKFQNNRSNRSKPTCVTKKMGQNGWAQYKQRKKENVLITDQSIPEIQRESSASE